MKPVVTDARTCIAFGTIDQGSSHRHCPVVVQLAICACECLDCKRAWWNRGRPILRDGEIVRTHGE